MRWMKQALLEGYYAATCPWRAQFRRARNRVGLAPVMVLFYHRVADRDLTPWTITNADFRRHLDYLQAHFEIVTLAEAQRRIATRFNPHPCVAITFDDGYADNCEQALPELARRKIPVTYFVTLENIETGRPFPHDAELGVSAPPNTVEQLRAMVASGLVEIGGHTRTHADLGQIHDTAQLEDEVIGATRALERLVEQPIHYFAFPFGQHANLNHAAINLCRQNGIRGVCSAYGGYNFPGDDPYHLQRIHGDSELSRLRNWLTVDPRKLHRIERFVPRYVKPGDHSGAGATSV